MGLCYMTKHASFIMIYKFESNINQFILKYQQISFSQRINLAKMRIKSNKEQNKKYME